MVDIEILPVIYHSWHSFQVPGKCRRGQLLNFTILGAISTRPYILFEVAVPFLHTYICRCGPCPGPEPTCMTNESRDDITLNQKLFLWAQPGLGFSGCTNGFRIADHARSVPACHAKPGKYCARSVIYLQSDDDLVQCFFLLSLLQFAWIFFHLQQVMPWGGRIGRLSDGYVLSFTTAFFSWENRGARKHLRVALFVKQGLFFSDHVKFIWSIGLAWFCIKPHITIRGGAKKEAPRCLHHYGYYA